MSILLRFTSLLLFSAHAAQTAYGDINSNLIEAVQAGDAANVEKSIMQGTDVNAKNKYGMTALMAAGNGGPY